MSTLRTFFCGYSLGVALVAVLAEWYVATGVAMLAAAFWAWWEVSR